MRRHPWIPRVFLWLLMAACAGGASAQPKSWEPLGPEGGRIQAIAQDPTNVQVLLVSPYGYPSRIFKSTNRGLAWSSLSSVSDYLHTLRYDPANPNIVYAAGNYYVHKSTNGGQSWTRYSIPSNYYSYALAIDPVNTSILHVSCDSYDGAQWVPGYAKSTDGGMTWSGRWLATEGGACISVAVDQLNPSTVYLGGYQYTGSTYTTKLFRSTDGGTNFVDKAGTMTGVYVYEVCADPLAGGKVFATTAAGIYRSTDKGESWTLNSGYIPGPYHLAVSKANTNNLFATTTGGTPYRSTDGGINWTAVGSGIAGSGYNAIHVETGASPYVYYGNNSSIYRSTNSGNSWQSCCSGINCASITALRNAPSAPATMYAGFLNNAVFKTTVASSATVAWQQLPDFYSCISVEDFAISAANPDKLYAMEGGT
jgi:photosystem II stability/assembly factor-like uncharacterized protein